MRTNATPPNPSGIPTQPDPTYPTNETSDTDKKIQKTLDNAAWGVMATAGTMAVLNPVTAPFMGAVVVTTAAFKYFFG